VDVEAASDTADRVDQCPLDVWMVAGADQGIAISERPDRARLAALARERPGLTRPQFAGATEDPDDRDCAGVEHRISGDAGKLGHYVSGRDHTRGGADHGGRCTWAVTDSRSMA
jgi:hypothetical protein